MWFSLWLCLFTAWVFWKEIEFLRTSSCIIYIYIFVHLYMYMYNYYVYMYTGVVIYKMYIHVVCKADVHICYFQFKVT